MSASLYLTFATSDGNDPHEFEWSVRSSSLAERWLGAMKDALESTYRFREQRFCGWAGDPQYLQALVDSINQGIGVINSYYGSRYSIEERAVLGMPQTILNILHHHFELLIGQSWRPSDLFKGIPQKVLVEVRRLNDFVHDYESAIAANRAAVRGDPPIRFIQAQLMPYSQIKLSAKELSTFSFAYELGDLTTSYCQLGKTWEEVFYDQDEHIRPENISPLRFLAPSFVCWFNHVSANDALIKRKQVQEFLVATSLRQGLKVNPENPKHALGHGVYASLPGHSPLARFSDQERVAFFREHRNITGIRLVSGAQETKRTFQNPDSYLGQEEILARAFKEFVTGRAVRKPT